MAEITASLVKQLREMTGAGMMDCKNALQKSEGDIEAASDILRKEGLAKAVKKAGRVASDGVIAIEKSQDNKHICMVEVNCETDFVARDQNLRDFAQRVAQVALSHNIIDVEKLAEITFDDNGESVEAARKALIFKIGENVLIRRIAILSSDAPVSCYKHGDRIGVLVSLDKDNETLGKDIAMHIAANRPAGISEDDIAPEIIEKEKEIFSALAATSGKPADIIEKMVEGRIKKFLSENCLVGQPFVKNPDQTVGDLLKSAAAKVLAFERFELGEGIEKKQSNFEEEVMATARGSNG